MPVLTCWCAQTHTNATTIYTHTLFLTQPTGKQGDVLADDATWNKAFKNNISINVTWQWVAFIRDNVGNPQFADVCEVDERCFLSSNPDHLRRLHHKFPLLSSHHVWVLFSHDVKDSVQELTDSSTVKPQPSSQWNKNLKKIYFTTGIQCKCTTPNPLHKTTFMSCRKKTSATEWYLSCFKLKESNYQFCITKINFS